MFLTTFYLDYLQFLIVDIYSDKCFEAHMLSKTTFFRPYSHKKAIINCSSIPCWVRISIVTLCVRLGVISNSHPNHAYCRKNVLTFTITFSFVFSRITWALFGWINDMVWSMNDTTCWGIQYIKLCNYRPSCSSKMNNAKNMRIRTYQIITIIWEFIIHIFKIGIINLNK